MKPFDIELAKQGKPVCTRDGRKVRIICFDRNAAKYHIVALIECKGFPNKEEEIKVYDNAGKYFANEESCHDLMMASEKKTGWINIYPFKHEGRVSIIRSCIYKTQKEAKEGASRDCIATISIEWEE